MKKAINNKIIIALKVNNKSVILLKRDGKKHA